MKKKASEPEEPARIAPKGTVLAAVYVEAGIGGVKLEKILCPNMAHRDSEMVGKALIKLGESLL